MKAHPEIRHHDKLLSHVPFHRHNRNEHALSEISVGFDNGYIVTLDDPVRGSQLGAM